MKYSQADSSVSWFKCTQISQTDSGSITRFRVRLAPTPSAISDPVGVYNLGRLCIQWCQNRDGRAAVGLCTFCALAPLGTAHSTNKIALSDWIQCVFYSFNECYRPNSAYSPCGTTDREFVTWTVWFNTDVFSAILIAVSSGLLFIITLYDLM